MALSKLTFEIIKQLFDEIDSRPIELITVGYPDCLVTAEFIDATFGRNLASKLSYREDSADIIEWHALGDELDRIIETRSLLELLDIKMTVLDINEVRGGEILCDLNEPLTKDLYSRFDIVLDGGTMEHCFNVGQVIKYFVAMAKVGRFILHQNPLMVMSHGFFNFNPTFYYDFYTDNGHELISPIYGIVAKGLDYKAIKLPPIAKFPGVPDESWLTVVIKKKHDGANTWPMQSKYKIFPELKKQS